MLSTLVAKGLDNTQGVWYYSYRAEKEAGAMQTRCNYCDWVGQEPSPADYASSEAYQEAYAIFRAEHDAQCPQEA